MYLEDYKINVRLKLSALWTAVMFCYIYGDYFALYVPKAMEKFIHGTTRLDDPIKLFAASLLMSIPPSMIFLTLALKPKISRLLNLIFGAIYTGIMLLIASASISPWGAFYVFLAIVESVMTSSIVWHAFKWPKRID